MAVPKSQLARRYYRSADARRLDASILMKAERPTGAVYLAGYVVEMMLKALVIETTPPGQQEDAAEDVKRLSHNLTSLYEVYLQRGAARPPSDVVRAFTLVSDLKSNTPWNPGLRYDPREVSSREAARFLTAVDKVYLWADRSL